MSKQREAAALQDEQGEDKTDGTFRALHQRTSGAGKGAASPWAGKAQKNEAQEKKTKVRPAKLIEVSDIPPRAKDPKLLSELFDLLDFVFPSLDYRERNVIQILWRNSRGAGQETCVMSLPEIHAQAGGMSISGIQYALLRLEARGLIEKRGEVLGKGKHQGVKFAVTIPAHKG